MRRFICLILAVIAIFSLSITCFATQLQDAKNTATLTSDGRCHVTLTATIVIDDVDGLVFPVPKEASRIYVNGSKRVSSKTVGNTLQLDLSDVYNGAGTYPLTITYELNNCIEETEHGLQLRLPMLSGFAYPVDGFEFSITLPGENSAKPAFSSGYHQSNIEKYLTVTNYNGSTITGTANTALKDHETLEMTLPVSEEMFPQSRIAPPSLTFCIAAIWICIGLGFIYWLIFLRCLPPSYMKSATAPEGCSAGELGSILCGVGADLTMMVFSWAQLGYLTIDAISDKVILYKQMDMGNERSHFERKTFNNLFRGRRSVDTGSLHYATLSGELAARRPNMPGYFHRNSGNPIFLRWIFAASALFVGVGLGISMSSGSALQWLWGIVFGALALLSGMRMQRFCEGIFLRKRNYTYESGVLMSVWLLLSLLVGQFGLGLGLILAQLLCSFLLYFGGRRTEDGRYTMSQVMGLRRYLRRIKKTELERIATAQPDFFHSILPMAMALGVHRHFARRFGKRRIPPCPYITLNSDQAMTATDWCVKAEQIVLRMEARSRALPLEKTVKFLSGLKR